MAVYIHIGLPKTGSSALQSHLALNSGLLAEFGYQYPRFESSHEAASGIPASGNWRGLASYTFTDDTHHIFSSEYLFKELLTGTVEIDILAIPDVTIVMYARDLFDFLISGWGQEIKGEGLDMDINDYAPLFQTYKALQLLIRKLTTKKVNFIIRNYSHHKNDLYPNFISLIAGNTASDIIDQSKFLDFTINRSMTLAEYDILRKITRESGQAVTQAVAEALTIHFPHVPSERPRLTRETVELIKQMNAPYAEFINAFLPQDEQLSLEFHHTKTEETANLPLTEKQLSLISEIVNSHSPSFPL